MKKRILAAAAASILLLSSVMGFTASAGETEAAATEPAIEWDDTVLQSFVDDGYAGTIFTIDKLGLQLLVPEGLEQRQPTDEEKEKDTILVFENDDQSQKIEFVLGQIGDCKTLEDVQAFMAESFPDMTVTPTRINEYDTLVYGNEEADSMAVLIGAGDAGFLRIILHPVTDPTMNKLYSYVAASIQEIKADETEQQTE